MKITDYEIIEIDVNSKGNWLFIKLIGNEDNYGLGEASQTGDDERVKWIMENRFLPELIDKNPFNYSLNFIRKCSQRKLGHRVEGFYEMTAISSIEQALWDFRSRKLGIPLTHLKGGYLNREIPLYANINRALKERNPEAFANMAEKAVNDNFKAIKCAPFDDVTPYLKKEDWNKFVKKGFKRIAAIRERIGDSIELMIDCHGRFTADKIIQLAPKLKDFNLYWLESPVWSTDNLPGLRLIRDKLDIRLAGGEKARNFKDLWPIINEGLLDVVMPDVKHIGGVRKMLEVAAVTREFDIQFSPHNPSGPVSTAFSAHICSISPNNVYLEFPYGEVNWRGGLVNPSEPVKNGVYKLNNNNGIGIELNDRKIETHKV